MLEQSNPGSTDTVTDPGMWGRCRWEQGWFSEYAFSHVLLHGVVCAVPPYNPLPVRSGSARGPGRKQVPPVRRGRSGISSEMDFIWSLSRFFCPPALTGVRYSPGTWRWAPWAAAALLLWGLLLGFVGGGQHCTDRAPLSSGCWSSVPSWCMQLQLLQFWSISYSFDLFGS